MKQSILFYFLGITYSPIFLINIFIYYLFRPTKVGNSLKLSFQMIKGNKN